MIKKLSMMVLGVMVVAFAMAMVTEGKAEAGRVYNGIIHHGCGEEPRKTGIRDVTKPFELDTNRAYVDMGNLKFHTQTGKNSA